MQKVVILQIVALLLCQIGLISGTPVMKFDLNGGVIVDSANSSNTLTGTDGYSFNFTDRFGGNTAIDLSSNDTLIRFPHEPISTLVGDYCICFWVYIIPNSNYQTIYYLNSGSSNVHDFDLDTNNDGSDDVEIRLNATTKNFDNIESYYNQWVHLAYDYRASNHEVTLYVNGQKHGESETQAAALDRIDSDGYLGNTDDSDEKLTGSVSEFAVYNTLFRQEYYMLLNEVVDATTDDCPDNTTQQNFGGNSSQRVCIHDTCNDRVIPILNYLENNLTISTNTSGLSWEDEVTFTYTLSDMTCGAGGDQECFLGACFGHTLLLADDSDFNLTAVPATVDLYAPNEGAFAITEYFNHTSCEHTANSSTCHLIMPFFFTGTVESDSFTRDKALFDYQFTVVFSKVPGEDTLTADLTNVSIGSAVHELASDVEANIENGVEALAGATLDFDGSAPASISVGDSINLELIAPAGHRERDYKNGTFEVELIFDSNGTEVAIPVTPVNTTFVNDGNSTGGAERSVQFTIEANYLGTYTIRAGATLESLARRRVLQQGEVEYSGLKTELQITVTNPEEVQSYYQYMLIPIVILGLVIQYYVLKRKELPKQQANKYEKQADLETSV